MRSPKVAEIFVRAVAAHLRVGDVEVEADSRVGVKEGAEVGDGGEVSGMILDHQPQSVRLRRSRQPREGGNIPGENLLRADTNRAPPAIWVDIDERRARRDEMWERALDLRDSRLAQPGHGGGEGQIPRRMPDDAQPGRVERGPDRARIDNVRARLRVLQCQINERETVLGGPSNLARWDRAPGCSSCRYA